MTLFGGSAAREVIGHELVLALVAAARLRRLALADDTAELHRVAQRELRRVPAVAQVVADERDDGDGHAGTGSR